MRAVMVSRYGGTDVLEVTDLDRPTIGSGKVLVEVGVAGVNYMDVYQRTGAVPVPIPFIAGFERVGVVTAVGHGVTDLTPGQRVGWLSDGQGSYADYVAVDAGKTVPDGVTADEATRSSCKAAPTRNSSAAERVDLRLVS